MTSVTFNASADHLGGCFTCRYFGHPVDGAVWCAKPGHEEVRSQAERGCAFWQREPCALCRTLIDEPWTAKPHDALVTFGTSKLATDFKTEFYECQVCKTMLKRVQGKSSDAVAWALVA